MRVIVTISPHGTLVKVVEEKGLLYHVLKVNGFVRAAAVLREIMIRNILRNA
jgi:hypothetical protein